MYHKIMGLYSMLVITVISLGFPIYSCRIISMTFKTFCRSITIENEKLAVVLIAHKNNWGIKTSPEKRNKMSLLGVFSYLVFFPAIFFLAYDWWVYITTGVSKCSSPEKTYFVIAWFYYLVALSRKTTEADRFNKGKIW